MMDKREYITKEEEKYYDWLSSMGLFETLIIVGVNNIYYMIMEFRLKYDLPLNDDLDKIKKRR